MNVVNKLKRLSDTIKSMGYIGFFIYCIITLGVVLWSSILISQHIFDFSSIIFILAPYVLVVTEISGYTLVIFFFFLIVTSLASILLMVLNDVGDRFIVKSDYKPSLNSVYYVFSFAMFFTIGYQMILSWAGVGIQAPTPPDYLWQRLYSLIMASVWEEILVRFLMIGVPIAVIGYLKGEGRWKDVFGRFGFRNKYVIVFLIISTLVFTLAHYPSWNVWKLPQVAVPGFLFGVLFIKHGLHAVIGIHLLWNMVSPSTMVLENSVYSGYIIVFTYLWAIVGFIVFVEYVYKLYSSEEVKLWMG